MYNLGQYVYRASPVHDRDPRVKIIAVLALSIVTLQAEAPGLLAALGTVWAMAWLARLPGRMLLGNLRPVLPFLGGLFLMYIFFTPGRPLPGFPPGPAVITYEGLYMGALQIGKFMLLVMAASVLTMTTKASEITMGLEKLLRPLGIIGISSHDTALMVSLALRFVPVLVGEINRITEAQLSRGAKFNPNRISGKIKAVSYLAIPLTLNIIRRCDELAEAMEARGYYPGPRTYLRELTLTGTDYWLIGACAAMVILVVI